jgi:hypothetical protein
MQTYKEKYDNEKIWYKKILILDSFHSLMIIKHGKTWTIYNTAKSMEVSPALVSENLRIAEALRNGIEFRNRAEAVRSTRRKQ